MIDKVKKSMIFAYFPLSQDATVISSDKTGEMLTWVEREKFGIVEREREREREREEERHTHTEKREK